MVDFDDETVSAEALPTEIEQTELEADGEFLTDPGAPIETIDSDEVRQMVAVYDPPISTESVTDQDQAVYDRRADLLEASYRRKLSTGEQEDLDRLEQRIETLRAPFYRDVIARMRAWEDRVRDQLEPSDRPFDVSPR